MQDAIIRTKPSEDEYMEASIIRLLVKSPVAKPWSTEELVRELKDSLDVTDALARLDALALVHRTGDLVFPTQAAVRAYQLLG